MLQFTMIAQKFCYKMLNKMDEKFFFQKNIFGWKWPKNAFFGPKIAKNEKKIEKFSKKIFFSKSIRNHLKRILKRKCGFRNFFPLKISRDLVIFWMNSQQVNPSSKHMCPDYGLAPRFFILARKNSKMAKTLHF